MAVTKKQFALNSAWKILEQFSAKGVSMIVSFILARKLSSSDYGVLALTAVFTNLSDILIDGGFSTALIRKEKIDEYDYSAVFSISSSMSVLLYAILFFAAPFVADYYKEPQLTAVLRVIGLSFFIQAFTSVRNGIVNRNMQFRLLFICNLTASVISGILGVASAYMGLGVWALVIQRLSQQAILTGMLFIKVKWKISWKLDLQRIKEMLSFSLGVVGSSLLSFCGGNIYNVAIGKKYSVSDLGYYDKGHQLPMQFSLYTFGAMSSVLLPTLSSCQDDRERVKLIVRKVMGMVSFMIAPLMVGMALTSKELIVILFSDRWIFSVPTMRWACLYYLATPFMLINVQVFFALGHSKLRIKSEIIRLVLLAVSLWVFGFMLDCPMEQLALVGAVIAVIMSFVTYVDVRKLIDYKVNEVIHDVWKSFLGSAVMGAVVYYIQSLIKTDNNWISLFLKAATGVLVYIAMVFLLKIPEKDDFLVLLKRRKPNE